MLKGFRLFLVVVMTILPLFFSSCIHPRPPKPGPNYIWVKPHTKPDGAFVEGHWQYAGPSRRHK
ncbi:MAG: hypothetical protein SVY10_06530 [Thermodesulfobacteriota bacterium]|nr:hypothetical protein [Thermodesulfobacteriota bacterium]